MNGLRLITALLLLLLTISGMVLGADTLGTARLRSLKNDAFAPGEFLKFNVNYGVVTAGEATIRVSETIYQKRPCMRVEFTLRSKPFFDLFYRVDDHYLTILDSEGVFPWRFEQHIREGGYSRDFVAEFDQINHRATTTEGLYVIPPYVHDIMSAFYFARTVNYDTMQPGQRIHLRNFYKDSTYELDVRYRGKQDIEVEAGTFRCVVIEPLVKEGGLFKSDGKIFLWLSDDERRLPIRVNTKIPIGSIDSELTEYYGIRGPLDAKLDTK